MPPTFIIVAREGFVIAARADETNTVRYLTREVAERYCRETGDKVAMTMMELTTMMFSAVKRFIGFTITDTTHY